MFRENVKVSYLGCEPVKVKEQRTAMKVIYEKASY